MKEKPSPSLSSFFGPLFSGLALFSLRFAPHGSIEQTEPVAQGSKRDRAFLWPLCIWSSKKGGSSKREIAAERHTMSLFVASLVRRLPPLTGGGFWVAFAQVALVYYGFAAAIHWAIPTFFAVESVQVGERRPGQVRREALLSIGEKRVFFFNVVSRPRAPPLRPRPSFFFFLFFFFLPLFTSSPPFP